MILVALALACVLAVPLTSGSLARLADLRLRWGSAALGSLALQIGITTVATSASSGLLKLGHLASYGLAAACLFANRRIPGLPLLALGAVSNFAAITANGGVMPASARAMDLAGLPAAEHFANSAPLAHPRLLVLGDVIPVPGPWPLGNVMSVGDLLITLGLFVVLHRATRVPRAVPSAVLR